MFSILVIIEIIIILLLLRKHLELTLKSFLTSTIFQFSVFFTIVYILVPLIIVYEPEYNKYSNNYSSVAVYSSNIFSFSFLILTFYANYFFNKGNIRSKKEIILTKIKKNLLPITVVILVIPFLFGIYKGFSMRSQMDFHSYMSNRIAVTRGKGFYGLITYLGYVYTLFCILYYKFNTKSKLGKILIISGLIAAVLGITNFLFSGSRLSMMIYVYNIFFTLLLVRKKPVSSKSIIISFSFGIFLMLSMSFYGQRRVHIHNLSDLVSDFYGYFGDLGEVKRAVVGSLGSAENLYWLFDNDNIWELEYGKTYIAGFINFVPRAIWKDKPYGGGPTLKNMIYPKSYSLEKDNVSSLTTGLISELYMNFGFFALLIGPIIMGALLSFLQRFYNTYNNDIYGLVIYVLLSFTLTIFIQYGEFLGLYSRTLFTMFVPVLLFLANRSE